MKLAGITLAKPRREVLIRLAGYGVVGFLSTGCALDGRAPLAAGFLAACPPGRNAAAALAGAAVGSFTFLGFGPALRCCGILVLICAIHSSFRETLWFQHALFRPLTAAGTTFAVELAYSLQLGLTAQSVLRLLACTALAGLLCHYCALLLRETAIPRRRAPRESEGLRQRLKLSADALRSLTEVFAAPPPRKEENPAVIFDRAAEVVCRGCAPPAFLERGRGESADFAPHFASRCIHFPQLLSAINTEVSALLLRRQYRRQLEQERARTRGQYAQLGELVAQAMAAPEPGPASGKAAPHDVALGAQPKEGQRLCGDSLTFFSGPEDVLYLLLSDGMGSGREAQRESQLTLRLMEQFLKAGIHPEPALKTVNAALNLRSDDRGSFTTIDLLAADLVRGQAALYKYGAAPTYIKHRGTVRRLTGNALPAGLQDAAAPPSPITFPLEENTFVLMVSDGVADAGDDQWLQDLLAGWQGEDPNVLVSLVLRECWQRRHGDDDRSAMCLYLLPRDRGRREV